MLLVPICPHDLLRDNFTGCSTILYDSTLEVATLHDRGEAASCYCCQENYLRRLDLESGLKIKHVCGDIKRFIIVDIELSIFGMKRWHMSGLPRRSC